MLLSAIAFVVIGSAANVTQDIPQEIPAIVENILERQLYIDPELDFDDPIKPDSGSIDPEKQVDNAQSVTKPEEKQKSIEKAEYTVLVGEYSTKYDIKNKKRTTNLKLAAEAINGKIINSNEEFSLNQTVGQRTYEKGYQEAKIIVNGKYVDGLGGGVCQVSTTLFNAALDANMTVTARKNHSIKSSYVPAGRDATVAWGAIDFKFKNPYQQPVKIVAECKSNGILSIKVLAKYEIAKPVIKIKVTKQNDVYTLTRFADGKANYVTSSKYQ